MQVVTLVQKLVQTVLAEAFKSKYHKVQASQPVAFASIRRFAPKYLDYSLNNQEEVNAYILRHFHRVTSIQALTSFSLSISFSEHLCYLLSYHVSLDRRL